jgi:hypothetical protein
MVSLLSFHFSTQAVERGGAPTSSLMQTPPFSWATSIVRRGDDDKTTRATHSINDDSCVRQQLMAMAAGPPSGGVYVFLRRRLKICYLLSAFNLQSRVLAPFFEGEGEVTLPTTNTYKR